jgi:hypothetical protein
VQAVPCCRPIAGLLQPVVTPVLFLFMLQDTEDLVNLKLDQHRNQFVHDFD